MQVGLLSLGDHLPDPVTGRQLTQAERHRSVVESAVLAEAAGFASVWLGEHHFCDYILSSPPVVLAAIAERTRALRLGTGVTLLANLDPIRVAEDYATLDQLSGGRLELVVGRGILARTYADFGQDIADSRAIYAEKLELLLRVWREEGVTWSGEHRSPLERATVEPRPLQRPHPPVWIGGGSSSASVDLAARLGLSLMLPSVLAPPEVFAGLVERYRERFTSADPEARPRVGAVSHVHVAPDSARARAEWRPYYQGYFRFVGELVSRAGAAVGIPGAASDGAGPFQVDFEKMLEGTAICGSPAQVVDRLCQIRERLGLDMHLAMLDLGGLPPDDLYRTIELYGKEVLPHVVARA